MKTVTALLCLATVIHAADKPFGTGMNGEAPAVPYQGAVESWNQTLAIYPEAGDPTSALFGEMAKINKWLESTRDPVCSMPDKKLRIAHMAAAKLGMVRAAPAARAAAPVAAVQVTINPPALITLIQQEEGGAGELRINRQHPATIPPRYTAGKWSGKTRKELLSGCIQQFATTYGYTPIYEEGAPVGGWKTEEGRRAAADRVAQQKATDDAHSDANAAAADARETQRKLDDLKREVKKVKDGF